MSTYDWLDKHIDEQAAYYGLTKEQHAKLVKDAAEYDEILTETEADTAGLSGDATDLTSCTWEHF